jgi:hypothetical protein
MTDSETKRSGNATWNARQISTVVAVVFWIWFLGSLAVVKSHPWVDTLWNAVWMLLLLIASIWVLIQRFRGIRGASGYVGYRGVPRWTATLFTDGVEPKLPSCGTPKKMS